MSWKHAETVMCPKVGGKRKLTSPKAWRPIALLSCLSKGLERLIARRLARIAIQHKVLSSQHFGALPKRGAVDLVAALVHDIETALASGKTASLLTMDIQGAFNMVQADRLWTKLIQQGWPPNIADWARSFASDRKVRIRFEDHTTELYSIPGGVPQGSPASPMLFMLYTEGLYRLGNPRGTFGFADDVAHLAVSSSLVQNILMLQVALPRNSSHGVKTTALNSIWRNPNFSTSLGNGILVDPQSESGTRKYTLPLKPSDTWESSWILN